MCKGCMYVCMGCIWVFWGVLCMRGCVSVYRVVGVWI